MIQKIVAGILGIDKRMISKVEPLKMGMTNHSYLIQTCDKKYIFRIPGEGTDELINRQQEVDVYNIIKGKEVSDHMIYIDPHNGYKLTEFIEDARTCNAYDLEDLKKSMILLKKFHNLKLKVPHEFDIFNQINYYESLWGEGYDSVYPDYMQIKNRVFSLKEYIKENEKTYVLTHIDAVPDNFLIFWEDGKEVVKLIDWEYAGMQDPDVDLAMFCIYAMYDRAHIDQLIDIYYENRCPKATRIKIYCYISACGLLWSNWCEYKRILGVDFGEYALCQYNYAITFYEIVQTLLSEGNWDESY